MPSPTCSQWKHADETETERRVWAWVILVVLSLLVAAAYTWVLLTSTGDSAPF